MLYLHQGWVLSVLFHVKHKQHNAGVLYLFLLCFVWEDQRQKQYCICHKRYQVCCIKNTVLWLTNTVMQAVGRAIVSDERVSRHDQVANADLIT